MPFIIETITSDSLKISTPAKINLFLEVLNKRTDGFHNLNSLFQAISLYDHLTFQLTDSSEVDLEISGQALTNQTPIPHDQTNLISRAWEAVREFAPHKYGVKISVEKNIPIAAGLGGGSSDAAASIMAANLLLDLNLSTKKMSEIGLNIGSDVPFFFGPGQSLISGRGEILRESHCPTDYYLVLVTPDLAISTAQAFGSLRIDLTNQREPYSLKRYSTVMEFVTDLRNSVNNFENGHFLSYPVLDRIKNGLLEIGASLVRMSGSGPTIFGLFHEVPDLQAGIPNAEDSWKVHTARPVVCFDNK